MLYNWKGNISPSNNSANNFDRIVSAGLIKKEVSELFSPGKLVTSHNFSILC